MNLTKHYFEVSGLLLGRVKKTEVVCVEAKTPSQAIKKAIEEAIRNGLQGPRNARRLYEVQGHSAVNEGDYVLWSCFPQEAWVRVDRGSEFIGRTPEDRGLRFISVVLHR